MAYPNPVTDRHIGDMELHVTGGSTKAVTLDKRYIFVPCVSSTVVNFPNVSEARGYPFMVLSTAGGSFCHLNFNNGAASALSTNINTANVHLMVRSNGVRYFTERS